MAELLARAPRNGPVPAPVEAQVERELSAVLGSASARLLLDAARRESGDLDTVAAIVGEASQDLRFNQQVLQAALQNMSQGISVIDREQRLVAGTGATPSCSVIRTNCCRSAGRSAN